MFSKLYVAGLRKGLFEKHSTIENLFYSPVKNNSRVVSIREKVDILINNALIVTMNNERRVIPRGYVAVRGDRVLDVGAGDGSSKYVSDEVIEGRRIIVTPGFISAHTHFYGALLAGSPWFAKIEPPTDFMQNLQRIWWTLDVMLCHDEAYTAALLGSIMYAKSGVTNFFDNISAPNCIDGILDNMEKAVNEVGIRGILSFEATQRRSREEGVRGVRENERFILKNNRDPSKLVKGAIYLHASFTIYDELFYMAKEISDKTGALIAIHTEEGLVDVYHNIERYGLRPIERMYKLGFLSPKVHLVHAVQATDEELLLVKKTGAHVAHNPMSNMLNAVGVPKVPRMLELGINVGLGDDGYVFNVFDNMRAAYLIHKVWNLDPRLMTPLQVVEMATVNSAKMFHQENELGSIEPGKKADIVILKPKTPPTPVNEKTIYAHIVNVYDVDDVSTVIVDGRFVVRDQKLVNIDLEKALEQSHKVVERLWDRMLSEGRYQLDYLK
ncbi:amidohydrolase family protein [Thermogladius sp. 4427co]|uniref:amidohydrolase family protein n=1 Tax=Thermogladius sp. 4427co TaxID=3450718 RepID=UPI003F7A8D1A